MPHESRSPSGIRRPRSEGCGGSLGATGTASRMNRSRRRTLGARGRAAAPERAPAGDTMAGMVDPLFDDLLSLLCFVRVVEKRSFSAAARALGVSKSVVSTRLARLEERLGERLVART